MHRQRQRDCQCIFHWSHPMTTLTKCPCGGEPSVENSFGILFAICEDCGAQGKSFPVSTMVGKLWPREAAAKSWNNGEREES